MISDPDKIVAGITKVATYPAIADKFYKAIQNPMSTSADLENIILDDPALTSRLLSIANSAMFSLPQKVDTVQKALTLIGQKQVHDIILSCEIVNVFGNISEDILSVKNLWRHSLAVACAARVIASLRREVNVERHFISGLLHDIGRLVLLLERSNTMSEVLASAKARGSYVYQEEKKLLGFDHSLVGGLLLKKWNIPAEIHIAIRHHHYPSVAKSYKIDAAILHIADIIVHAVGIGSSGDDYVPKLDSHAWGMLEIDIGSLNFIIEQMNLQYNVAATFILGDI